MSLIIIIIPGVIAFGICALLLRRELKRKKERHSDSSKKSKF